MEATAAHYSPRLGFLKRNLWPRTHFKHLPLHSSPTGICNKFQNKMDGKNQQLHSISLVRKRTSSAVSNPHWTQFFLRCGPEWVILIYSNMGFAYSSLFYMFFIVLPEKKKKKVSYPLLVLQLLAWYFLNHYLFWHTSDFSWKMGSRVCCTLKGHIHLERRKEEDICMRVRNHSDPSLSAPVINMLQNRRHLLNFVVDSQLSRHSVAGLHSQRPVHSDHVCQDTTLLSPLLSPCKMWIRWQKIQGLGSILWLLLFLIC